MNKQELELYIQKQINYHIQNAVDEQCLVIDYLGDQLPKYYPTNSEKSKIGAFYKTQTKVAIENYEGQTLPMIKYHKTFNHFSDDNDIISLEPPYDDKFLTNIAKFISKLKKEIATYNETKFIGLLDYIACEQEQVITIDKSVYDSIPRLAYDNFGVDCCKLICPSPSRSANIISKNILYSQSVGIDEVFVVSNDVDDLGVKYSNAFYYDVNLNESSIQIKMDFGYLIEASQVVKFIIKD